MNANSQYDFSSLKGKTAVITGGAGILGKHFSEGLASCGSHVVIVDLNKNEAEILASDLTQRYGQHCISIECDVSEPASVNSMVDEVVKQFGDIHVLHNNAASKSSNLEAFFAPFEEYTLDQWREVTKVNLDGMFMVAQAVGRKWLSRIGEVVSSKLLRFMVCWGLILGFMKGLHTWGDPSIRQRFILPPKPQSLG